MPLPLVIIHGWSDSSQSFTALATALAAKLQVPVTTISLADWISMDDHVTYDDLVTRMDQAWSERGLPRNPRSVDVIVHSTGALVIRDWLVRNFASGQAAPIHHLVMLAPANFGAPLAHKGASFIGRVVKGWNSAAMFEVGALILKGLEVGSPYAWKLAQKDRFGTVNVYDKGAVLTTVIVGNTGWTGIAAAANEPGSDGTVRVSTANMNCSYVMADLSNSVAGQAPQPAAYTLVRSVGKAGFLVLDGLNHGQVHDSNQTAALNAIVAALQVDDAGFDAYCGALDQRTAAVLQTRESQSDSYYWGYQNAAFYVHDQFDQQVQDYFIEFFDDPTNFFESLFHSKILQDVHAYTDNYAYRAMLLDITTLRRDIAQSPSPVLKISLSAQPDFASHKTGYATFNDQDIGAISLTMPEVQALFRPNETVLIEIKLQRQQRPEVFKFS